MTIVTIIMDDPSQPVEVQAWLDANPDITISRMMVNGNFIYILY
jgi:hypothetical protein